MSVKVDAKELKMLRDEVRAFAKKELDPHMKEWENNKMVSKDLYLKYGEVGFLGTDLPEKYGGTNASFYYTAAIIEELARQGHNGHGGLLILQHNIVAHYIANFGTNVQKDKYLGPLISGACIPVVAMTEPSAGSDLQNIATTAERDGDSYILNGSKTFITNAHIADLYAIAARTDPDVSGAKGMTIFLIEGGTKGLKPGTNLEKLGLHTSNTGELYLDNVRAHKSQILGALNRGFILLSEELPRERVTIGIHAVGAIEAALNWTIDHVKGRQAFGGPLSKLQNTRFKFADMYTKWRALKALANECVDKMAAGKLTTAEASMLKLLGTEDLFRIIDDCVQFFGGYGYMKEIPIAQAWVDARIQRIYGGTSEIMKVIIARSILD